MYYVKRQQRTHIRQTKVADFRHSDLEFFEFLLQMMLESKMSFHIFVQLLLRLCRDTLHHFHKLF